VTDLFRHNQFVMEIVTDFFRHNKFVTESPSQFQKEDMGLPGLFVTDWEIVTDSVTTL